MSQRSYAKIVAAFRRKIRALDIILVAGSLITVLYLRGFRVEITKFSDITEWLIILLIPFLFAVFLSSNHSWESEAYVGSLKFYEIPLRAAAKTLVSIASFAYLIKEPVSRITVISIITSSTFAILSVRFLMNRGKLVKELDSSSAKFLVLASPDEFARLEVKESIPNHTNTTLVHRQMQSKGCLEEWQEICKELEKDNFAGLVIGDSYFPTAEVNYQISTLQAKKPIEIYLQSSMTTLLPRMQTIDNNELIRVSKPLLVGRHAVIKRSLDVVLSATALVLLAPVFLLTAIGVLLTSPGPILYTDQRIGRNSRLFAFPKFRSMVVNADQMRSDVLGSPDESMPDRYARDPRVTGFGRFIRRWSIDELPQIWCVLIGTMSIVGPRPILREEDIDVQSIDKSRFIAKPGLTGLWQVSGRKEVLWEARMKQDVLYIETWSFFSDLLLIVRTFGTILRGKGAM